MAKKGQKPAGKPVKDVSGGIPQTGRPAGLFVVGTDTGVGKTYVAALIAASLRQAGKKVGVYKPVASGCRMEKGKVIADDAVQLWEAAGRPGKLTDVCPQRFLAPLAPHLAAVAEGKQINAAKLRSALKKWTAGYEFVIVEGAGGWMSPLGKDEYVADLAAEFGFPLVVVSANRLGTINQTLQTLISIAADADSLEIAGVVLNDVLPTGHDDSSVSSNLAELRQRCIPPVLAHVQHHATAFRPKIDWSKLAARPGRSRQE